MCTSAGIFQINDSCLRRRKELWVICSREGYTSCFLQISVKEGRIRRSQVSYLLFWNETASMMYAAFEYNLRRAQPSKWDTAYIDALFDRSRHVDAAAILERSTWCHSPYCRFAQSLWVRRPSAVQDCGIFRIFSDYYGEWCQVDRYNMADGLHIAAHWNSC